jgi:hypothetical protein
MNIRLIGQGACGVSLCHDLFACVKQRNSLYFTHMNSRNQALAVSQLLSLTSTLLLAGLLLRASAQ